jgi:N-acetylneuraminic acid mutarotase
VIDGQWHVAGGRHVVDGPSDAHEVYDPKEDRWRTAAPMPKGSGAGGNTAGVLGGQLYVFGGEYFHDGGKVHAEVWRYDPKADAWHAATPMPTPRHAVGAVAIGDWIYVAGGGAVLGGGVQSAVHEAFTLQP